MTDSMAADVRDRLMADASFLEISLTLWPLYKAMAASMMVGVGRYPPRTHTLASMQAPCENASA